MGDDPNRQPPSDQGSQASGGAVPPTPPPPGPPAGERPQAGGPQPPPWQGAYPVPQRTNGLAIASLVLGIIWLYWVGSILALVFGYTARRQIDASEGWQTGRGLATAGIVLGWVGVATLLLTIVVFIILIAVGATSDMGSMPVPDPPPM